MHPYMYTHVCVHQIKPNQIKSNQINILQYLQERNHRKIIAMYTGAKICRYRIESPHDPSHERLKKENTAGIE